VAGVVEVVSGCQHPPLPCRRGGRWSRWPAGSWCAARASATGSRPLPAGWPDGGAAAHRAPARQGRGGCGSVALGHLPVPQAPRVDRSLTLAHAAGGRWSLGAGPAHAAVADRGDGRRHARGRCRAQGRRGRYRPRARKRNYRPLPHPSHGRAVRRTWWSGGHRDDVQVSSELQPGFRAVGVSQRSSRR
jgi:hypothetical protein